jgi:hypothetical protein
MSCSRYFCLFVYIVMCCVFCFVCLRLAFCVSNVDSFSGLFVFVLRFVYPMLTVSLDCSFVIL